MLIADKFLFSRLLLIFVHQKQNQNRMIRLRFISNIHYSKVFNHDHFIPYGRNGLGNGLKYKIILCN